MEFSKYFKSIWVAVVFVAITSVLAGIISGAAFQYSFGEKTDVRELMNLGDKAVVSNQWEEAQKFYKEASQVKPYSMEIKRKLAEVDAKLKGTLTAEK